MSERKGIDRSLPIRNAIRDTRHMQAVAREIEEEAVWNIYAADISEYLTDEWYSVPHAQSIHERIASWKETHQAPAFVVDLAGMASGKGVGADLTMNVALEDPEGRAKEDPERIYVQADITTTAGQKQVLSALDAAPSKPLFIFFLPGAAIAPDPFNPVVASRLAGFLKELYARLDEEGGMFLALHLWNQEYSKQLKTFLDAEGIPYSNEHRAFHIYSQRSAP